MLRCKPRRISPGMAIPLKAISIAFCGRRLISEGFRELLLGLNERILPGLLRCKPSKINPPQCSEELF
jgi:hypothetical protein